MNRKNNTWIMVECALMIALSTVLSLVKILDLPQGGSITAASMVPISLVALRHGTKWGLTSAFALSLLQMLIGFVPPPANDFMLFVLVILLDYVLAFTVLGLSRVIGWPLRKHRAVSIGVGVFGVCMLRYLCSFLSGILVWYPYAPEDMPVWLYSLTYNGSYMIPEAVLSCVVAVLLGTVLDKVFPGSLQVEKERENAGTRV